MFLANHWKLSKALTLVLRELIKVYGLIIAPWSGLWQVTVVGKGVMMMIKVKIERLPQKNRKNGGDELRATFPKLFAVTTR